MPTVDRPTMTLRGLQSMLLSRITHPDADRPIADEQWLSLPPRGTIVERLAIYADGYPARVEEALRETFPAVFHLIGHRASHGLVAGYVSAHPSTSWNVDHVGRELPAFLERDALAGRFPFLKDLASLEWAVARAFHATERPPLDRRRLVTLTARDWSEAVLEFQSSVCLQRSNWPILALWESRDVAVDAIDIEVAGRPQDVLVRRSGHAVECSLLEDTEADVLGALLSGATLAELGAFLHDPDRDYSRISQWIARWMQQGILCGIQYPRRRCGDEPR